MLRESAGLPWAPDDHLRKKPVQDVEECPAERGNLATAILLGRQEGWKPGAQGRENIPPIGEVGRHGKVCRRQDKGSCSGSKWKFSSLIFSVKEEAMLLAESPGLWSGRWGPRTEGADSGMGRKEVVLRPVAQA